MSLVGEAGDVAGLDEQPGCAGRPDAMQLGERAAGGGEQLAEFLVGRFLAQVDAFQVGDELGGDPAPCLARRISWPNAGQ
jgi:hypothetical protein